MDLHTYGHILRSQQQLDARDTAVAAGTEAFRRELEDLNQHIEDALRLALQTAIDTYRQEA
jgi:outer membrane receptor for monomeric catechols